MAVLKTDFIMNYKIKKGDRFLCLEDYVMDDERISYSKGKIYKSDLRQVLWSEHCVSQLRSQETDCS